MTKKKPPAQIAAVSGIAPEPIVLTPEQPAQIPWAHLYGHPPFQMFAVERAGKSVGDVMAWMPDWARSHESEQGLFDDYCQWHEAKGYWPNETPTGEIEGADK